MWLINCEIDMTKSVRSPPCPSSHSSGSPSDYCPITSFETGRSFTITHLVDRSPNILNSLHHKIRSHQKIRARAPLWWSGDHKIADVIPTLHWCPDDRLSEGYYVSVCVTFLTLCTRRKGGLHSSRWTRGVDAKLDRSWDWLEGDRAGIFTRSGYFLSAIF